MSTFLATLTRSGPEWDPARSDTHLRVDAVESWTIRLDGRNA